MTIKRISQEVYEELKGMATTFPELMFQNEGYQYLKPPVRERHASQIERISTILKEHVTGFSKFFNFCQGRHGLTLRFDYDWGADNGSRYFIGVGYLALDHLYHGFPDEAE